jgi:twitching motility two-component system response regulator PilH
VAKACSSILVIHSAEATLHARAELFRSAGFGVLAARSGQQALKLLNVQRPDVVLLDTELHDMSGLDVSHEIKTDPRLAGVKVILCSASFNTPRDQLHGLEAGKADIYLSEPIKSEELLSVARRLLPQTSARAPRRARRRR